MQYRGQNSPPVGDSVIFCSAEREGTVWGEEGGEDRGVQYGGGRTVLLIEAQ